MSDLAIVKIQTKKRNDIPIQSCIYKYFTFIFFFYKKEKCIGKIICVDVILS